MFGLPISIAVLMFDIFNLIYNLIENKFWAYGNVYLIWNTLIQVGQGLLAILVTSEFPFYLKHFKFVRSISLVVAVGYVIFYLWCFLEWMWNMYFHTKEIDFMGLLFNLFFSWNTVFHFPVLLTNMFIILKEVTYDRYHVIRKRHGVTKDQDLSLHLADVGTSVLNLIHEFNPIEWF